MHQPYPICNFPRILLPKRPFFIECISNEEREVFINSRDSLPRDRRCFLTLHTLSEYNENNTKLFLTSDKLGGFGLKNRNLISVFSHPGAHYGYLLVEEAVRLGASYVECMDVAGFLPNLYMQFGFKEVARYSWQEELAHKEWVYEKWGRPDFICMEKDS